MNTKSDDNSKPNRMPTRESLLIVAVGSSAGGLPALRELFRSCPVDENMSFLIVQHMGAGFETHLPEILASECEANGLEARLGADGDRLQENAIFVVPPGMIGRVDEGILRLEKRKADTHPHSIDDLFCSLAADQGANAVGILLSGTGHDGTQGLSAIRDHGGLTIAQDETTAHFPEMPRNAIRKHIVDIVLAPKDIFSEVIRYKNRAVAGAPIHAVSEISNDIQERLFRLLKGRTGVDFSNYRMGTILRRLNKRLLVSEHKDIPRYLDFLESHPEEIDVLYRDLLINVTSFFRDEKSFDVLRTSVFPELVQNAPSGTPLRIWVPACSSGEEAYSLAIALTDFFKSTSHAPEISIFATDIDDQALKTARDGKYTECAVASMPKRLMKEYFESSDGQHLVKKEIRELCVFARQDVIHDPPFSRLDLISCRNLFIYFNPSLQKRVLSTFHYALKPGRYLFLGSSESVGAESDLFSPISKEHRVFVRSSKRNERLPVTGSTQVWSRQVSWRPSITSRGESSRPRDLRAEVHNLLIPRIDCARVVINEHLNILFMEGPVDRFFHLPTGAANLNILKMARPGLGLELRAAIHKAVEQKLTAERKSILLRNDTGNLTIDLEVIPFNADTIGERLFLLLLSEAKQQMILPELTDQEKSSEFRQIEQELIVTREFLQSVIAQQDAASEELKAANEEIMSRNEELQSANEELETTKEELQAGNEELTTVNDELVARNHELNQLNSAVKVSEEKYRSLTHSASDAIVTTDSEGKILMWNSGAERVFGYKSEEAVGTNITAMMPARYRVGHTAGMRRLAGGGSPRIVGKTVEIEAMRKDGSEFPIELSLSRWHVQDVTYFTSIIRDVSERVWARRLQMARLEISKVIFQATSIAEVLYEGLRIICQQIDFKVGAFWKYDREKDVLRWDCMWPAPTAAFKAIADANASTTFSRGQGMLGFIWDSHAVWIQDLKQDPRFLRKDAFLSLGLHTSITFPVGTGNDFFGLVEVFSSSVLKPDPNVLVLLDDVGSYLNHFIRRKLAEEKVQQLIMELEGRVAQRTGALVISESRHRFLAEASLLLASSSDYTATLQSIANLCIQKYADWCVINLFSDSDGPNKVAVAHANPEKVEIARRLAMEFSGHPEVSFGPTRVRKTGRSEIVVQVSDELIATGSRNRNHTELLNALHLNSYVCVPMKIRDSIVGTITLVYGESGRHYMEDEVAFIEELAHRTALAVDRVRLLNEAQSANRAKDEFLATLSHELRTPMNIILGWVEILRKERDEATVSSALEMLERNTKVQIKLIDDLIDISRITTGKLPIELAAVNLKSIVLSAVSDLSSLAKAKEIDLYLKADVDCLVLGDHLRLQQVLQNLLNNAIKFTPGGGRIEVSLEATEKEAVIRVKDSGVGIQPDFLPHVFETFKQEDGTSTRQHGGLGLGLAISKYLIRQHNGRIEVTSEGRNKGSTFSVVLPLGVKGAGSEAVEPAPKNRFAGQMDKSPLENVKILVIDDSSDILHLMNRKLRRWGAEVHLAMSAEEGFLHLVKTRFDIILCDIGMPKQDGLSFIRELRSMDPIRGATTPAIALTAYARAEEIQAAIQAGFNRHVSKPVSETELLGSILETIGQR